MWHERVRCIVVESACSRSTCAAPRHMPLAFIHLMHQPARLHAGPGHRVGPRAAHAHTHAASAKGSGGACARWMGASWVQGHIDHRAHHCPSGDVPNKPWKSSVSESLCC